MSAYLKFAIVLLSSVAAIVKAAEEL